MNALLDVLPTVWQRLAKRNDWQLVRDEQGFFQRASNEYETLFETTSIDQRARGALMRTYSVLLYEGLQHRHERAVEEVWLACYRLSRRGGWTVEQAQEVAQETVARVLANLPYLRLPHSCLAWVLKIHRTVCKTLNTQSPLEEAFQHDNVSFFDPADPTSVTSNVEERLIAQQFITLLREKVPNQLECYVLLRVVVFGEHPRDIARELQLPLHRTRVAKSRALHRLRQDPEVNHWLTNLLE